MRIMYLTWGETPRTHGVFQSQIINQLLATAENDDMADMLLVSGLPVLNSGLTRERFRYFGDLKKVRRNLKDIPFKLIIMLTSQTFFVSSRWTFSLLHSFNHWALKRVIKRYSPDIIHCRSYHAAYAACKLREGTSLGYKVVFDCRGLWPEESALKKGWDRQNANYQFLKKVEQYLLNTADSLVALSEPMVEHYQGLGAKNIELIYTSADVYRLAGCKQRAVNSESGQITFCFLGSIAEDSWHQPSQLLRVYKKIRKELNGQCRLKLITMANHTALREAFQEIPDEELELTSTKTIDELKQALSDVDFGILPYRKSEKNSVADLVGKTMVSTKAAEFLSAGIPLLVNEQCGGAAKIVTNTKGTGIVYSADGMAELTKEKLQAVLASVTPEKLSALALNLFDYEIHGKQYSELYRVISSKDSK